MIGRINRRETIMLLGGAAAAWPLAARAQQAKLPVIGYLSSSGPTSIITTGYMLPAFRQGLKEAGYAEGQNVAIEYRWADGKMERLPVLVAELVSLRVAVIFATSNAAAQAAKSAGDIVPVAFAIGGDPVSLGLVASIRQPGRNMMGATFLSTTIQAISLQMLHEAVPNAGVVGVLMNPSNPNAEPNAQEQQQAARMLGLQLQVLNARTTGEIDMAFATFVQSHVGALVINGDPFFSDRIGQIAALTLRHAIPAIYPTRDFVDAGGLMTYGASNTEATRLAAIYTGRILKGEKPSDLPVQQSTKVELILNLITAKTIGVTFPLTLLGRADAVIE
jgi:putative ABC transport system substrate-binding protein